MPAAKGNNYNPEGRPKKPIDWDEFEKLCGLQCTQSEIASWFSIISETLVDRVKDYYKEDYSVVYKRYSEGGKASLRRTQVKLAQKSAAMAIFLGKQKSWLGQSDIPPDEAVSEAVVKPFVAVMAQLAAFQSARNMEESRISSEQKSE